MIKQLFVGAVLATSLCALAGTADAGALYLGLPNGTSAAYAQHGQQWTRTKSADLPDVGSYAHPALADLDGDGDQDAVVGEVNGNLRVFVNTGTNGAPVWIRQPSLEPTMGFGARPAPALADVDGDGDVDAMVGTSGGAIRGVENIGSSTAPAWRERAAWNVAAFDGDARPALGHVDGDGRLDLIVGYKAGAVHGHRGTGNAAAPFMRDAAWDSNAPNGRVAVTLASLVGDKKNDLVMTDGFATTTILENTGGGWGAATTSIPDPGSGPAGPAFAAAMSLGGSPAPAPSATPATSAVPTATVAPTAGATTQTNAPTPVATAQPGGNHAPIARLAGSPASGSPLAVRLDASASHDADGDPLSFAWDFGDGSVASGGAPSDPIGAIRTVKADYTAAKNTRDAGHYPDAVAKYLVNVDELVPLTTVTIDGPVKAQGTNRIDRVARWYLQKSAHDLGGIYLWHSLGLANCERYATSLQYSRESEAQAIAGGFPGLPATNGTTDNIRKATEKLIDKGCAMPAPRPMFPVAGATGDPIVTHQYAAAGSYTARVTVSDGTAQATASITIIVGGAAPSPTGGATAQPTAVPTVKPTAVPTNAPGSGDGNDDPVEGFGAHTRGGEGGRKIRITAATDAAVRAAFNDAESGNAEIVFEVAGPIAIKSPLPQLTGNFLTVEGNGVTLVGTYGNPSGALIDVRGHDVIVRNMRIRNGGDNLRAQGKDAYNIVFSHISSTGAADDGISIGYGAHDVTVQYCFLAGNTRSLFMKYGATTRISVHHTWVMKQWIRGPLVSGSVQADLRNLIVEDWALWGARFENGATGNMVGSLFRLGAHARSVGGKPESALRMNQAGPVFTAGNVFEGLAVEERAMRSALAPMDAPAVTTLPMEEMVDVVEGRAGCLPRDGVDRQYIDTQDGWDVGESSPFRINP